MSFPPLNYLYIQVILKNFQVKRLLKKVCINAPFSSVDEADSAELAVEVLRGREELFPLLRQDLDKQLRPHILNGRSRAGEELVYEFVEGSGESF